MSFGKMRHLITLISNEPAKDSEGFGVNSVKPLAAVWAYKEERHGSEAWKNRAAFSQATALFRLRVIPGVAVTPAMSIICGGERYNIVSAEYMRGMYIEALAEKITPSEG